MHIKDRIDETKKNVQSVMATDLESSELSREDKALVTEMVYGTFRRQGSLDWIISTFALTDSVKIPLSEKNIIRLALYQILFIDNIPDYAAINEAVEQAKSYYHAGMGSFTNGLLRNVARNKTKIKWPDKNENIIRYLSVYHSHPEWMVEKFLGDFGEAETVNLLEADNERPTVSARVNTLKISRDELSSELLEKGYRTVPGGYVDDSLIGVRSFYPREEIESGKLYLQSEASMLVSRILEPRAGETVIDLCAGSGGKTTHIGQLMRDRGRIIAVDINEIRLQNLREACLRYGVSNCETVSGDATKVLNLPIADKVLVDAPCSGLGVLSRRPDIRWNRSPEDIKGMAEVQKKISKRAAGYLKKGGILVYSVCTITPEETVEIIEDVLASDITLKLIKIDRERFNLPEDNNPDFLQLLPHRHHTDGMFIAKFKKAG